MKPVAVYFCVVSSTVAELLMHPACLAWVEALSLRRDRERHELEALRLRSVGDQDSS